MIGLDTSAIIDLFKGVAAVKSVLAKITEPFAGTQLNYAELMIGLDPKNSRSKIEEKYYDELFKTLLNLTLDTDSSKKAAEIYWDLKRQGRSVEMFDCLIAAIYIRNGINFIVTKNSKHFKNIKGLKVISY